MHLQKGEQHLNGEQALALARTRHIDSDTMPWSMSTVSN
ncbi:LCP family protein [Bacillus mycoides]